MSLLTVDGDHGDEGKAVTACQGLQVDVIGNHECVDVIGNHECVDVIGDHECVDVIGDHDGGRIIVDDQVTGEGNQEVVGLETLCREGRGAGEKVSKTF